ncbi:MAG: Nicotinate-nucleotide--dimethylbenzimidazole phosphoribosyltransferase [Mycobacterium sp.]|jgi:nicotinate-nucleotide--dimethylbenzimidazole phosphoribosyltransferase|nr:Nicotinate-nucleotide--dimethylbenzimidazole phosphoribosyltransferase [Mycobacterium sp.]
MRGRSGVPAQVRTPDKEARAEALARQAQLTKPAGALGRLEELSAWVCAVQGSCPPRQFSHIRVVIVAADHGIAAAGVSAYPPEVTAQMVANFAAGGAAVNVLARQAGATVRVVDDGVGSPSGRIDREDALSAKEFDAAFELGRAIVDDEVDSGCDLLIPGDMGIGNTTPAAAVVAGILGLEPVVVVGRGTGVDDAGWMRKTTAIRDALRRSRRSVGRDPEGLLRVVGGRDLATMTGLLIQAGARRTPVILDGVVSCAAALAAERMAPGASAWWVAGTRSTEPAQAKALSALGLEPLLDLQLRLGEGTGALLAVNLVQAAAATLAEMATFAEAGVSDKPLETVEASDQPAAEGSA